MNTKFLAIFGFILITFTACKDYLEVDSPSTFSSDYIFSNTADAKKAILGVYSLFGEDPYTSRMSCVWMQNTDVEAIQPSANPDGSRRDIWSLEGKNLSGFSDIYKAWQNNYLAIDRANQCIEGIKASDKADDPDMQMILGEAYCLKAYRYFLLCNFWGDVPYFDDAAKAGMQLDIPRTDKNYIYTACIQDLVNAEEGMYFADEYADGIERMNREFALGMIARLSLFRAGYGMNADGTMKRADDYLNVATDDSLAVTYTYSGTEKTARTSNDYYQLAKDYCEKLISLSDRELNSDFAEIFYNECVYNKPLNDDVLYEVAFLAQYGGDVGWCVGSTVQSSSKGASTIQVNLTPTYYFSFDDDDTRRDATFSRTYYKNDNDKYYVEGTTGLACAKWNRLWLTSDPGAGSSKGTGINWPLMRYSDILLMLAEAENELNGPTSIAKDALKRVRQRAFSAEAQSEKVDQYVSNLGSKEDFFNAVVDERAWEFGGECLRKFDLVRWNNYGTKIIETKETLDNMGKAAFDLELENPDVAQYADYANYLYYRKENGEISFMNVKYRPAEVPETIVDVEDLAQEGNENAYARANWSRNLYSYQDDEVTGERTYDSADYTIRCWRGYTDPTGQSAVPYVLPISTTTIGSSDYLTNDGYLLN
ncbi:RagB/SusD family nutrient uptake outer membrane protein [Mangrovibacterium lignilyticum]|uniref:RagB/SusD family nutrient uptake outer membrane protein n=1 Tax=Mangrovibacterium lignilyticum TaxID=2668052 RepID=UPI0013D7FDCC|nr:RagB/SusD family nutrient uptake outer membrane protein [Mangrovibacterium lignilyticum]